MNSDVKNKNKVLSILNGTIIAIAITLIMILLFAVLIRFVNISDSWIFPINQVIKIISLFVGINVVINKTRSKGFAYGLVIGLVYYILSFLVFSILQQKFVLQMSNLYDLLLTTLIGGLIGLIVVNFKKN